MLCVYILKKIIYRKYDLLIFDSNLYKYIQLEFFVFLRPRSHCFTKVSTSFLRSRSPLLTVKPQNIRQFCLLVYVRRYLCYYICSTSEVRTVQFLNLNFETLSSAFVVGDVRHPVVESTRHPRLEQVFLEYQQLLFVV